MNYYIKYNLRLKRFYFVNLIFDHYILGTDEAAKHTIGSYIPISYQEEIESSSNYAFYNNAKEKLDSNFYITPVFENTYLAIQFIKLAAVTAKDYISEKDPKSHDEDNWPSSDYIRLTLPGLQYLAPSGQVTIDENNYVKRSVYLMEITASGFVQVNPKIGEINSYEAVAFLNGASADCYNTKDVIILKRSTPLQFIIVIFCIINCLALFAALLFTIKYRAKRVIKCFSPAFHYFLILGLLIASGTVLTTIYSPENNNSLLCYLRINFVTLSYSIITSLLLIKTIKIKKSKRREVHKIHLHIFFMLRIFLAIYLIPLIVSVLYQAISHTEYKLKLDENETTFLTNSYYEECSDNDTFVYIIFLLLYYRAVMAIVIGMEILYGLINSIQARKKANEFLDSYMLVVSFVVEYIFFKFFIIKCFLNLLFFYSSFQWFYLL